MWSADAIRLNAHVVISLSRKVLRSHVPLTTPPRLYRGKDSRVYVELDDPRSSHAGIRCRGRFVAVTTHVHGCNVTLANASAGR